MLNTLADTYAVSAQWANENEGVVSVLIFIVTVAFGWASGIFSALRRIPKFKLELLDGPTFCCTFSAGKKRGEHEVHRTGIALYLTVANIGSAPSSIHRVTVGYHWHLRPFSIQWLRYSVGWFWLPHQAPALADFQANIGGNLKVYPFLMQKNFLSSADPETYLEVGRSTNGVVYFEQTDSWGGCRPTVRDGRDSRKYNPAFGKTFAELHGEKLPFDESI